MTLHTSGNSVGEVGTHFVRACVAILESRPRKDPVQVRVREHQRVAAALTYAARASAVGRAQEVLPEPQRKSLLAYPAWTRQQKRRRKRPALGGVRELMPDMLVTKERNDRHASWMREE